MNKVSQEKPCTVLNSNTCQKHLFNVLPCDAISETTGRISSLSSAAQHVSQAVSINCSYSTEPRDVSVLKASLKTQMDNHLNSFSPLPESDSSFVRFSRSVSHADDTVVAPESTTSNQGNPFKYPYDSAEGQGSLNLKEANSTPLICTSPSSSGPTFFVSDSIFVNGSTSASLVCSTEGATPTRDTSLDINGHSGSHTPASPNASPDRVRMDLSKLDETIDYVISNALSDNPCEGMFVLTCRNRELAHLSSPIFRANTPSSGHLVSPSPPPTPSSPHSHHVTSSPLVHSTSRPHALLQSGASSVNVTHPFQRYVVDQGAGLVQFSPFSMGSQCIPPQRSTQQPVSFVHLYSDPGPLRVHVSERPAYSSTVPPSPMVFHQNIQRTVQNHLITQTKSAAYAPPIVNQSNGSTVSPSRINLVQAVTTQTSKAASVSQLSSSAICQPLEASVASWNQALLLSPPASVCCVVQNPISSPGLNTGPVTLGFANALTTTTNSSIPLERNTHVQSPGSVSFRQPIVPTQPPISSCISSHPSTPPVVPDQIIPLITPLSSAPQSTRAVAVTVPGGPSKRRSSSSSTTGPKRRKTSTTPAALTNYLTSPDKASTEIASAGKSNQMLVHDYFERLKLADSRSLVSAPVLKPFGTVLPPTGASDSILLSLSQNEEKLMLKRRGFKYHRGMMSIRVPKCFLSDGPCEDVDDYITRYLHPNPPIGPMVHESSPCLSRIIVGNKSAVCPSPEPITFENHMMTFFSSIQQSPTDESKSGPHTDHIFETTSSTNPVLLTPKLLPIFSDSSSSTDKPNPGRSTPPLPLLHIPNPKLISGTSVFGVNESSGFPVGNMTSRSSAIEFPNQSCSHHVSPLFSKPRISVDTDTPESSPVLDSETGESSIGRHPSSEASTYDLLEKLNITFTLSPSLSSGVFKLITRITELLGIDQGSFGYQVTRSEAQISIVQRRSQIAGLICRLESELRDQFASLSLRFDTSPLYRTFLPSQTSLQHSSPHSVALDAAFSPLPNLPTDASVYRLEVPGSYTHESIVYSEDPVSIVSLLASKHVIARPCQFCDKMVIPGKGLRKNPEDIAVLTGLIFRSDTVGELTFCSDECLSRFSRFVLSHRCSCAELSGLYSDATASGDSRPQSLVFDLASTTPVLLQTGPPKTLRGTKRQHSCSSIVSSVSKKRGGLLGHCYSKHKRWKGVRWRSFSSDSPLTIQSVPSNDLPMDELLSIFRHDSSFLRLPSTDDQRTCALCWVKGDAPESSVGRLLPLDVDRWLHINCALWCYEVYETIGGSLNNVSEWLKKAKDTTCSECGRLGAGLPCYNPRCTFVYHVFCALSIGCMFFTDRGMYCPQHQPREAHPMQLPSLTVNRRVYITRDENAQIGSVIHEEDQVSVIRVGTLSLHNIGQLLPHQLESGFFHNRRYIYPVGFRSTRIYWSMRVPRGRSRYLCEIAEKNGRPLFRVTASDRDMTDECVEHETCADAWQLILTKVERIRNGSRFLRLFSQHLKGEDMYGLSEPHIVRAIESLPGVDCLRDYVFNFGRMELIAEMPLAINPSGCARSEPKMQTYVKRSTPCPQNGIVSTVNRPLLPGVRRPVYLGLSLTNTVEFSKQYQSSRSQQYRRLKGEASSNVILGRSRIQGLGLFAARELEPQTMVIEYIGELIRIELSNKREKEYEAQHRGIYMFRLDHDTVIDATMCGGLARYVNHSCQPNCFAEYLNFGDRSHIVIITNRRIEKGEELCYDYNFDLEDGGSKIPCLCRAVNCRKWMN